MSLRADNSHRPYVPLLLADVPIFSRALLHPLRLFSLAIGIAILIAGSFLNFFYCMWLFWICGLIWNVDWAGVVVDWKTDTAELRVREVKFFVRLLPVLLVIVGLTLLVAFLCGFARIYPFHWNF